MKSSTPDFELLPHTADLKIRVYGASLQDLFRNALIGMFQAIEPQAAGCCLVGDRVVCKELPLEHTLDIQAPDLEALLVDFLSHALSLSDVHNEAYLDARIDAVSDTHIKATIRGVAITGFQVVEIKSVTHHDLKIKQIDGQWQADIVFDI